MDLSGKRFGQLISLSPTDKRSSRGHVIWECLCDCGNVTLVPTKNLCSGNTKSCGCSKRSDLTGKRFGRLTVLSSTDKRSRGYVLWQCLCDCGNVTLVPTGNLCSGNTQSCGCFYLETRVTAHLTHGRSHTPKYNSWAGMIQRCFNPKHPHYKDYGGRGITVEDKRWMKFENLLVDMGLKPSPEHSLDRFENNKGYCKENCHWATPPEQANNRRSNIKYLLLDEDPILS